jgi:hypothetical protein
MSSGAGGLVFGLLVGSLVTWFFLRRPKKTKTDSVHLLGDTSVFGDSMVRQAPQDKINTDRSRQRGLHTLGFLVAWWTRLSCGTVVYA